MSNNTPIKTEMPAHPWIVARSSNADYQAWLGVTTAQDALQESAKRMAAYPEGSETDRAMKIKRQFLEHMQSSMGIAARHLPA